MNRGYDLFGSDTPPPVPATLSGPYPTDGDPANNVPATIIGAWYFHQIFEELRNVLVEAGITPDHKVLTQLRDSFKKIVRATGLVVSGVKTVAATTTLPATDVGKKIILGGSGGYTVTLPKTADVQEGDCIAIGAVMSGTGFVTLSAQGTDTADFAAQSKIYNSDEIIFVRNGSNWSRVMANLVETLKYREPSVLITNGYKKFADGLIIEWMTGSAGSGGSIAMNTLPFAFPNGRLMVNAIHMGGDSNVNVVYDHTNSTNAAVALRSNSGSVIACSIIAIGY